MERGRYEILYVHNLQNGDAIVPRSMGRQGVESGTKNQSLRQEEKECTKENRAAKIPGPLVRAG